MARLIDEAVEAIRAEDSDRVAGGVRLALSFIEHDSGRMEGLDFPEVVAEPASPEDLARLRDLLTDVARAGPPPETASLAVFTLGKLFDPGLTGFFVQVLRTYLRGDAGVLYQAMIALDNLEVNVFAGRRSMSVLDEDENRALAADFLRRARAGADPPPAW